VPDSRSRLQTSKHHVEDDRVVLGRPRHPQRIVAGARDVGGEPFLDESSPEQPRHLHVILDHQDPHACIVAVDMRSR